MRSAGFGISLFCLVLLLHNCHATDYVVGGKLGWIPDARMKSWPRGKHFYVGDMLIFNYDGEYNVVAVDKFGYDNCMQVESDQEYITGHDRVRLKHGVNYFICSRNDACSRGMKMAVNVTSRPPPA